MKEPSQATSLREKQKQTNEKLLTPFHPRPNFRGYWPSEIQQHNKPDDAWVRFSVKVYLYFGRRDF